MFPEINRAYILSHMENLVDNACDMLTYMWEQCDTQKGGQGRLIEGDDKGPSVGGGHSLWKRIES